MLLDVGIFCAVSGLVPMYKGDNGMYVGDGYKLTFAKFEICAIAIEMGMQPTFIDSDIAITASLPAALALLNVHDIYFASRQFACDCHPLGFHSEWSGSGCPWRGQWLSMEIMEISQQLYLPERTQPQSLEYNSSYLLPVSYYCYCLRDTGYTLLKDCCRLPTTHYYLLTTPYCLYTTSPNC